MADAAAWATEAVPTDRPNMTTRIVTGVEMECEAARGRTVPHAAITGTRSVTATICKTYAARVTGTLPYAMYCDLDEWRLFARPILQGASKPNPLAESSASPTSETPTEGDGGGWSGNGIARRARVKGHLRKGHLRWRTRRIGWQAARHVFVRTESAVQSVQILVAPLTDTESARIFEFRISKHAWPCLG